MKLYLKSAAMGTLGNCSGGVTPWGTILTCEENYDAFYGEAIIQDGERTTSDPFCNTINIMITLQSIMDGS